MSLYRPEQSNKEETVSSTNRSTTSSAITKNTLQSGNLISYADVQKIHKAEPSKLPIICSLNSIIHYNNQNILENYEFQNQNWNNDCHIYYEQTQHTN